MIYCFVFVDGLGKGHLEYLYPVGLLCSWPSFSFLCLFAHSYLLTHIIIRIANDTIYKLPSISSHTNISLFSALSYIYHLVKNLKTTIYHCFSDDTADLFFRAWLRHAPVIIFSSFD